MSYFKQVAVENDSARQVPDNSVCCPITFEPYSEKNPPMFVCTNAHRIGLVALEEIEKLRPEMQCCPFCRKRLGSIRRRDDDYLQILAPAHDRLLPTWPELDIAHRGTLSAIDQLFSQVSRSDSDIDTDRVNRVSNQAVSALKPLVEIYGSGHPELAYRLATAAYYKNDMYTALLSLPDRYRAEHLIELQCRQFRLEILDGMGLVPKGAWSTLNDQLGCLSITPETRYRVTYLTLMTGLFLVKETRSKFINDARVRVLLAGPPPLDRARVLQLCGAADSFIDDNPDCRELLLPVTTFLRQLAG
jgi:hypothetical protein